MLRFDVDRLRLAVRAGGAAMRCMVPRRMPGMTVTDLIPIHEDDPGGSTDSQCQARVSIRAARIFSSVMEAISNDRALRRQARGRSCCQ